MTPAWVVPEQWKRLKPPASVLARGLVRTPEALLETSKILCVRDAKRYQPPGDGRTWCNIYLADVCDLLGAPMPHVFDLGDGKGKRELRANDIVDGLRAAAFPGWEPTKRPATQASLGIPTVGVWKNPNPAHSGHVVLVSVTGAGLTGVFVTGAGRKCVEGAPIRNAFGSYTPAVEFFTFTGDAP